MKGLNALIIILIMVLGSLSATSATSVSQTNNGLNNVQSNGVATKSGATADKNWTSINYDPGMSRNSPQITINKTNVNQLIVKWKFNTTVQVENPPLIFQNVTYFQNNIQQIFAVNLLTGKLIWKYDPKVNKTRAAHGMFYQNGIIYASTGQMGTVVALNATNGHLIWKSPLIDNQSRYYNPSPPILWNNYIIVGGGGGDNAPLKGSITALNKTNGKILWHITTTVGSWVTGSNATVNGGGAVWSGGSVDTEKGIIYLPVGNPSPDSVATHRQGNSSYTNEMVAVNITNGKIIWATPFIQVGTVLNVLLPDVHDWDTSWGSQLVKVKNGTATIKLVIGHDKYGDIMAMDSRTGKPVWWMNLQSFYSNLPANSTIYNYYGANDNNTLYIQNSPGTGNGTIIALDLLTGNLKWKLVVNASHTSPLLTNSLLFGENINQTTNTAIIIALNKYTGNLLWQANVGALVGEGGPSIGQGMLLVPTYNGYVFAFGLNNTTSTQSPINNQISNIVMSRGPINIQNTQDPNNKTTLNTEVINGGSNSTNAGETSVISDEKIPMQKTGLPLIPAIFGIMVVTAGFVDRKIRK